MKGFIFVLSFMFLFTVSFGGMFDSDAMNNLAQELNAGLEEVKEESEWDIKEKKAKAEMKYKDKIRQAKIAMQRDIEKFIRQKSATFAGEDFYRENYIHKTPACEFTLYYMDTADIGDRLYYRCPVKVPSIIGNTKEVQDYRLIGKNNFDKGLYMLVAGEDLDKGVGVNFTFPPNHKQTNCLGYTFYFFENPKQDIKKGNGKQVELDFTELKTWKLEDYIEEEAFVCEEGR